MRARRILALLPLLSSCAQPLGNGPVDWDHGARRGRVLATLDAGAAAPAVQACTGTGVSPEAHYATVRYRGSRLHHTVVAALPEGGDVRAGDEVELRPPACAEGRLARVERVLVVHAEAP